jgi:site-specific recombinase XerD
MDQASHSPGKSVAQTSKLVEAFLQSGESRGLSPNTLRWYRDTLVKFAHAFPQIPHEPEKIEGFIATYRSSNVRKHGVYRALRTFYNWLAIRHDWQNNPIAKVDPPQCQPKEKPALTLDQLRQLLEYPGHSPEIRALLYLLADTGVRIGEALSITSDSILPNGSIVVRGKTGQRIVPISDTVRDMLLALGRQGRIFPHSRWYYSHRVTRAFKEAGVPGSAISCVIP